MGHEFKKGDAVIIHPRLNEREFINQLDKPNPGVTLRMRKLAGKEAIVSRIKKEKGYKNGKCYKLLINNQEHSYWWTSEMFLGSRITLK